MDADSFLDALLSLPGLACPRVSPDGRRAAWSWYRTGPAADVYTAPTDGSGPVVRLTESAENTLVVSWTPDSGGLLARQDRGGDERDQLLLLDPDRPGEMRALTEPEPSYYLRGGDLHPNGRWLVYGASFDVRSGREVDQTWIYRHDLTTGERLPLARPARPGHARPQLNRPGTHVLYHRSDLHPSGRQAWLVDIEGRHDREIVNCGPERKVSASWLPDGRRVLVTAETETHRRVGFWDLGTESLRWLLDDPGRSIEGAHAPSGTEWLVVVEARQGRARASLLDPRTGREAPVSAREGTLLPLAPAADGTWIGEHYSALRPPDLVRFRPEEVETIPISVTGLWERTPLRPADLCAAEPRAWRSVDGLEVRGWLYRASGEAAGTVVYVHGGPTAHSEDRLNAQIQYLVSCGFHVLDPNYRGSTGYGLAFQEAIKRDGWGGLEQEDIRTGIQALIAEGIAAPGRVGITGTSYGGYSSWCAITRFPPETVAAAAPICGMTDLVMDYEATRPDIRPYTEEMMGGRPEELPEKYRERSPVHDAGRIRGRLLIVQGLRDPNVPMEHVRVMLPELERVGADYALLVFDDEGHGIQRPANQRTLYRRLAAFFRESLAGA